MNNIVMAVNAGSSTIKFQLFEMPSEQVVAKGLIDKIGKQDAVFSITYGEGKKFSLEEPISDYKSAIENLLTSLTELGVVSDLGEIIGVGHRVAHGGERFSQATVVTEEVLQEIVAQTELAPLHNPANVTGIKTVMNTLPDVCNVAVFDTAFHQTMKPEYYLYAIPYELYQKYGVRRYGFHGTSHAYVAELCAEELGKPLSDLKVISCHLGSGASICAIDSGESVNTSMGFTPLAGLMMGTRCGDIDPSISGYLQDKLNTDSSQVQEIYNKESGLLGISQLSNDCREIELAMESGNLQAQLALDMFVERIRHFIGSYMVQMGGLDALIFTGGIGENSRTVRSKVTAGLSRLGIEMDDERNKANDTLIHSDTSKVSVLVLNTNEELMIAREVYQKL
ncbi:acetate kinase [Vibrio hannami]|uniref:acetate/propionate family kinase n=1 Tax=Vibrio hannami TaxID=2717094 RepID=UPI00240F2D03|nr:acetate kinase [Vibrio hannami]MDG3085109.1 acetate kinase [Vibrio hannami]